MMPPRRPARHLPSVAQAVSFRRGPTGRSPSLQGAEWRRVPAAEDVVGCGCSAAEARDDKGDRFSFGLDNSPEKRFFVAVRPGKGCFRRCLVAGRHRRARVRLATAGLARGGGPRSEGPRGSSSEGADAVSGSRGSRPAVQGPYRRPGSAWLPGASREAGSRPSSPGRTSGRFCASRPLCPWVAVPDRGQPARRGPRASA